MLKFNQKYFERTIHAIVWICLFFYAFIFSHFVSLSDIYAIIRVALLLLLLMCFFYTNSLVLIPKLLGRKKIVLYFLVAISFIFFIAYASGFIQVFFNPDYAKDPTVFKTARDHSYISSFLAWVISSGMKITNEWFKDEQKIKTIENEKLQSELSFLKSQVNPHFLFNALNNIYSLEHRKSGNCGEAILRLSELVRYMLYETSTEYVSFERETEYLRNYIELQKMGIHEDVKINLGISGDMANKKIEPMLLIPLVENAFKHGISYRKKSPIDIQLSVIDSHLKLRVENNFEENDTVKFKANGNGIGLVNLRKRLELLYPGKYNLAINRVSDKYIAELKLDLKYD